MAIIEPEAIRSGLKPRDLWGMTIGEIEAVIKEVTGKERETTDREHRFMDLLNGKFCALYASFHGVESCPADHMVTAEPEEDLPMTPEAILDRAVARLSRAGQGGTS